MNDCAIFAWFQVTSIFKISLVFLLCLLDLDIYQKKFIYNMMNNKKNPNCCITGLNIQNSRRSPQKIQITEIQKPSIPLWIYVLIYKLSNLLFFRPKRWLILFYGCQILLWKNLYLSHIIKTQRWMRRKIHDVCRQFSAAYRRKPLLNWK